MAHTASGRIGASLALEVDWFQQVAPGSAGCQDFPHLLLENIDEQGQAGLVER